MKKLIIILSIMLFATPAFARPFLHFDATTPTVQLFVNDADKGNYPGDAVIDLEPLNLPNGTLIFTLKGCNDWGCGDASVPLTSEKEPAGIPTNLILNFSE